MVQTSNIIKCTYLIDCYRIPISIYEGKKNEYIDLINQMGVYDNFYYNFEDNDNSFRNSTNLTRFSSCKNNNHKGILKLKSVNKDDDDNNMLIKRKKTKQVSLRKIRDFSERKYGDNSFAQRKLVKVHSSINVRKNNRKIG